MDDAFCGGGDSNEGLSSTAIPIQASAVNQIKAAIFMGDPRYIKGLPYEVGTCAAQGVSLSPIYIDSDSLLTIIVRTPSGRILMPVSLEDPVLL